MEKDLGVIVSTDGKGSAQVELVVVREDLVQLYKIAKEIVKVELGPSLRKEKIGYLLFIKSKILFRYILNIVEKLFYFSIIFSDLVTISFGKKICGCFEFVPSVLSLFFISSNKN